MLDVEVAQYCIEKQANVGTHACIHTYKYAYRWPAALTHAHTQTHTQTHARTHTHTHTYTRTHRWPVALNCKHVYNWTSLTAKKSNGKDFALTNCASKFIHTHIRAHIRTHTQMQVYNGTSSNCKTSRMSRSLRLPFELVSLSTYATKSNCLYWYLSNSLL